MWTLSSLSVCRCCHLYPSAFSISIYYSLNIGPIGTKLSTFYIIFVSFGNINMAVRVYNAFCLAEIYKVSFSDTACVMELFLGMNVPHSWRFIVDQKSSKMATTARQSFNIGPNGKRKKQNFSKEMIWLNPDCTWIIFGWSFTKDYFWCLSEIQQI